MKKFLALLAISALMFGVFKWGHYQTQKTAHLSTHRLGITKELRFFGHVIGVGHGVCSATAIGRHALMTAEHCEGQPEVLVDDKAATIVRSIYDGHEHVIWLMSGVEFKNFSRIAWNPLEQGDSVYIYGNPAAQHDRFRQGYVESIGDVEEIGNYANIDLNVYFGDSGSAIFNNFGNITSVVSALDVEASDSSAATFKTMIAYDLSFRQSDYDQAVKF